MMIDKDLLRLVDHDGSSDYSEAVGEHGGYVSYGVSGGVLTVTAEECPEGGEGGLEKTSKSWRLVPLPDGEAAPGAPADVNRALEAARGFLSATECDADSNAVIAMSLKEAASDQRRILSLGDVRILLALAEKAAGGNNDQ